jgi:uncharacterized protein
LAATAILAGGLVATPALASKETMQPGHLLVHDDAKLFTPSGIDQAKKVLADTLFDHGVSVRVSTFLHPPESKKAAAEAAKNDPVQWREFVTAWAKEQASNEGAKGIFVLICRYPGGIAVIADKQTRDRGFTDADEQQMQETLIKAFRESVGPDHKDRPDAALLRDAGLKAAVEFVVSDLKDTTVATGAKSDTRDQRTSGGMGIMGWVCIGLVVLLGVWLVVALIRAFSGGGSGPGGGGGFFPALLGGLFGAAAGMWLYSQFAGGGGMFGGSEAQAGDAGGDAGGDTGAGDYSDESGAGGGFDDGGGGGDWGGGDFGGDF